MKSLTRLELSEGTSRKFWEVFTKGNQLEVRFGRLGGEGQRQRKTFASAAAAQAAAAKLTADKRKKGYGPAGSSESVPSAKAQTRAASAPRGPAPLMVSQDSSGDVTALWLDGKDVWFAQVFEGDKGEELLRSGAPLAEAVQGDGGAVERWRFASAAEATRAAKWAAANAAKKHALKNDASADFTAWSKRIKKELPRIPHFDVGAGALKTTRDQTHPWIYPRVPATSFLSGRLMVPVFSLVGPLDARLGKTCGLYVSACPQAVLDPYIDSVLEVVVQDPARKSTVDAYFESSGGGFWTVHLSQQTDTIDSHTRWAVTEHTGNKGTVGWYRTAHVKTLAEAQKLYAEKVSGMSGSYKPVAKLGSWYTKILEEIDHHNRVPSQKPKRARLTQVHAAMLHGISESYSCPSRSFLSYDLEDVGGVPSFCQEDWDYLPKNPWSKGQLLALVSLGVSQSPLWSTVLNDGDAGTFNFFAAPGEPFGVASFSCH